MAFRISALGASGGSNGIVDLLDVGGTATIEIRTGAEESATTDGDGGTLLATLTMSATAFGNASAGVATAATITSDTNVDATGTAGHFRMKSGGGIVIMQGPVATSGATITFNTVNFIAGGTAAISSFTFTVPQT